MDNLTFGEQVKIMLSRKGMTIKQLAERIEKQTGKTMSRQNLTQRLGRDNFQEQDMRLIAAILECPFHLSIFPEELGGEMSGSEDKAVKYANLAKLKDKESGKKPQQNAGAERDITIGELYEIHEELDELEQAAKQAEPEQLEFHWAETTTPEAENQESSQPESEDVNASVSIPENEPESLQTIPEKSAENIAGETETYTEDTAEYTEETATDEEDTAVYAEDTVMDAEDAEEYTEDAADETILADAEAETIDTETIDTERIDIQAGQEEDLQNPETEVQEQEAKSEEQPVIQETQPVEEVRYEEPVKKKDRFRSGGIFLRRKNKPVQEEKREYTQERKTYSEPAQKPVDFEPVIKHEDGKEDLEIGEMNPYTGHEYQTNSVRMHPNRIGYVQVYDRKDHKWTDMTEWAFLGYQERKKALLGKDYEPPIYLD